MQVCMFRTIFVIYLHFPVAIAEGRQGSNLSGNSKQMPWRDAVCCRSLGHTPGFELTCGLKLPSKETVAGSLSSGTYQLPLWRSLVVAKADTS